VNRTGAPGSHQRTWEEDDLFPLLFFNSATYLLSETNRGLRPSFSAQVRWREPGAPVHEGKLDGALQEVHCVR
jgi:hypothetical protein